MTEDNKRKEILVPVFIEPGESYDPNVIRQLALAYRTNTEELATLEDGKITVNKSSNFAYLFSKRFSHRADQVLDKYTRQQTVSTVPSVDHLNERFGEIEELIEKLIKRLESRESK